MAQPGHMRWAHGSPDACKCKQDHQRPGQVRQGPHPGADMVDDDWETDPDYINNGSRLSGDHEISTESLISDLSRSLRDCGFLKSSPHSKKQPADFQRHHHGYKGSGGNYTDGGHPPPCPHGHPAPELSIERSSLFYRNAAEKLDTFFSEKLKAWGSDAAQQSDAYEHTEAAQEELDGPRRRSGKGPASPRETSRGQKCGRVADGRGDTAAECPRGSRETWDPAVCQDPGPWHLRHSITGKGRASEGLLRKQEGGRPPTAMSTSARILPQCQINHIQRCWACQAFNRDQPPALQEEDEGGVSNPHQKERTPPSSKQQISDRLSKVQQWLEQTPAERPPGPDHRRQQKHRVRHQASLGTTGWDPAYASRGQKEGGLWGRGRDAGDCRRMEPTTETRHRRKSHAGESPHPQPAARAPPCDDTSTSPATCACLFCEQQRPRARLVSDKTRPNPSADEVALRLQAENRIAQIVEAFERRSLREAEMAEQERAFEAARRRGAQKSDPEKRAGHGTKAPRGPKRGHRSSGTWARQPRSKEKEEEEERKQRGEARNRAPRGKEPSRPKKCPSFLDRLRGIH